MLTRRQASRLMSDITATLKGMMVKVTPELEYENEYVGRLAFWTTVKGEDGVEKEVEIATAQPRHEAECLDAINFLACVDQLVSELYTEPETTLAESEEVTSYNNPRHRAITLVKQLFEIWGADGFERASDRVLARRVIDHLEEVIAKPAYDRGVIDGATYGPKIAGVRSRFETWWLER